MEMVQIRSVKQFFNEFIVEPVKENGVDWLRNHMTLVKNNLLDTFRKEIFGQIVFKLGPETEKMSLDELAGMEGIGNILEQSFRKWRRLCILCTEHGLGQFLSLDDLKNELLKDPNEAEEVILPNPDDDVTDKMDEILPEGEEPVYLNGGVTSEEPI